MSDAIIIIHHHGFLKNGPFIDVVSNSFTRPTDDIKKLSVNGLGSFFEWLLVTIFCKDWH